MKFKSKILSYFLFDYPNSMAKKILPPFLLGLLLSSAFQPRNHTILGFISLLLFYRHFEKRLFYKSKEAFSVGYWYGFGYFTGGLYWITYALHIDWAKYAILIPLAAFGISSILAIGLGVATYISSKLRPFGRLLPLLGFILTWTLFELIKGHMLTGFPWLNLAEIWLDGEVIIQNLAFVGPYGLGLITLLLFALLYCAVFFNRNKRPKYLTAFFTLSAVLLVNGRLHLESATKPQYDDFDIVLVQPNILQIHKWDKDHLRNNIDTHVRLSKQSRLRPQSGITYKPKLYIWPEASVPYIINSGSSFARYITQILEQGDYLILGGPRKNEENGTHHNSLYILDNQGQIIDTYDKTHLVPYGEYIPYRNLMPTSLQRLAPGDHDYTSGSGIKSLSISGFPAFSPLICYEAIFTGNVVLGKELSAKRPKWMLNLTNDGWYLDSPGIHQHLQLTRMRSIEEGMPLVRVVYRGISAVFDSNGRLKDQIHYNKAQALVTQLPPPLAKRTFYSLYGHNTYFVMLFLLIFNMLLLFRYSLKKRKDIIL